MPIWQKQAPLFLFLRKENRKMTRFFERGTPLAEMERQMMMAPNFTPRSNGSAVLCRYRSAAAEVDCQSCVRHRRQSRQGLTCLHLTKRLQAGMVTVAELAAETVRPWKHLGLKQRTMGIAGRAGGFHFADRLHIMRMLEMTRGEKESVSSRWLAAVYLLSASAPIWQRTLAAVKPGQIDFAGVRLGDASIQDYVLYRTAKGLSAGALGVTSEELADAELVSDDTLLLILCAALIARYGPEVMNIGRAGGQCGSAGRAEQFQREQGPQMGGMV